LTYDELLELLEGRGWPTFPSGAGSFRTFCPVCEGDGSNSPSFAVKRSREGEALLYCFSGKGGCGLDAGGERDREHVDAIFEAFGSAPPPREAGRLWRTRNPGGGVRPEDAGAVEVARYEYEGATKVRYEWPDGWRKDFRWRPRKPGPLLYMPPLEKDRWVLVVEGEKDVDRLRAEGLQATAPSEGHLTAKLARKLEGFRVAVLRDYDAHGKRARAAAMDALASRGVHAVAVDLPGLEERESRGEDVSDWLDRGGTAAELRALVLEADGARPARRRAAADRPPDTDSLGWAFRSGWLSQRRDKRWIARAQFNVVPHEVLVDEDGQVRGYDVTFEGAGPAPKRMVVPSTFMTADKRGQLLSELEGPDLMPAECAAVAEFLSAVRASGLFRTRPVLTRAEWRGGELRVPGELEASPGKEELVVYGDAADVAEDDARREWRNVVDEAAGWPKLAVLLGFPLGALYVTLLKDKQIFTVHVTGESHTGKSESAEMAFQQLGDARRPDGRLYRSWNQTAKAPGNVLKQVGVLPVWFDEAANLGLEPDQFTQMLFNLMEGRERKIAGNAGRNVSGTSTWSACVLSTGEARLTIQSGLTGVRRRIMELYSPLADDVDAHLRMLASAQRAHGWPLRWLARDPRPAEFLALQKRLFLEMAPEASGQQVELAQAGQVATCVAGFAQLARVCGRGVEYGELEGAALSVFEKLQRSGADEGADIGERGLNAVKEALLGSGRFFPANEEPIGQQRWGVWFGDDTVGIIGRSTLALILREYAGLRDPKPVLDKWAEQGVLSHDRGRDTRKRKVWVQGRGLVTTKLFVVRIPGSTGSTGADQARTR
jgi:hypothetical protein